MEIRTKIEKREKETLSKYATLSCNSKGREIEEEKCQIRTAFQRDRDRILHSKSFRRLKHKTQVFISPEGDHFRTRLTHTLEVAQVGRTIGRALGLNEDLIEAIALGHDLGHTPFGHTGERILNKLNPKGFKHNEQSLRVVDLLELRTNGKRLNLTYEVRDGILNHSGENKGGNTLEATVVSLADRIAYINHDIDDAVRAGILNAESISKDILENLGYSHGERINTMILDIIRTSDEKNYVKMSEDVKFWTDKLRNLMFERVYLDKKAKAEEVKAEYIIGELYKYYFANVDRLPSSHMHIYENIDLVSKEDIICDYIAGMTDRYVMNKFNEVFVPTSWNKY